MIKDQVLVTSKIPTDFERILYTFVQNFQEQGLEVQIQYSTASGASGQVCFSALVIGRNGRNS